jgi:hypothetical protein
MIKVVNSKNTTLPMSSFHPVYSQNWCKNTVRWTIHEGLIMCDSHDVHECKLKWACKEIHRVIHSVGLLASTDWFEPPEIVLISSCLSSLIFTMQNAHTQTALVCEYPIFWMHGADQSLFSSWIFLSSLVFWKTGPQYPQFGVLYGELYCTAHLLIPKHPALI